MSVGIGASPAEPVCAHAGKSPVRLKPAAPSAPARSKSRRSIRWFIKNPSEFAAAHLYARSQEQVRRERGTGQTSIIFDDSYCARRAGRYPSVAGHLTPSLEASAMAGTPFLRDGGNGVHHRSTSHDDRVSGRAHKRYAAGEHSPLKKTNQGLREILTAPAFGGRRSSQEFFATIHIAAYAAMRPSPSRHKTSHEGRQPLAVLRAPWERPLRHRRLQTRCNERGSACRASPAAPILPPAAYLDSLRPLLLLARPSFQLVNLAPCQL